MEKDTSPSDEAGFLEKYSEEVTQLREYGGLAKEIIRKHLGKSDMALRIRVKEALEELKSKHGVPLTTDPNGPYYEGIQVSGATNVRMAVTNDPKYNHIRLEDGERIAIENGKEVRLSVGGKYRPIDDRYELTVYYDWGFTDPDQQAGLEKDRSSHRFD